MFTADIVIQSKADMIAPDVLDSLGRLGRFLSRPWVKVIVRVVLYLTLGGLPGWIFGIIDFLLSLAPAFKPEVVQEISKFRDVLLTLHKDAPEAVARNMTTMPATTPWANPQIAAKILHAADFHLKSMSAHS
jgi:hypothetical protein